MIEPIVSRDSIRDCARAAAESGQSINAANPYPPGTAAHIHFERDFWAAVRELEAVEV